ncbi:MAG: replication factor C large subunit, partial [Candidatus Aenigmatarchaeota archaeon]
TIFKTETAITARRALEGVDEEPETVFWWIENNIANEYKDAQEIAKALDKLSMSNLMFARIKSRQRWSLLSYAIELMTAGVAMSKKNRYGSFTPYKPPQFLMMMGRTKRSRATRNEICAKIGKKLHASSKNVRTEYLPYLKIIMKNDPKIAEQLGLGDDEIEFLK